MRKAIFTPEGYLALVTAEINEERSTIDKFYVTYREGGAYLSEMPYRYNCKVIEEDEHEI